MALVKYNNNSISAVTSASSIPVGALTHIKTLSASSSSTISFVDGSNDVVLDSTYPIYKFEFINCHPSVDNSAFQVNFSSDGGSNYNVTKTTTYFFALHKEDGSNNNLTYSSGADLSQSTSNQQIAQNIGADNDQSMCGNLTLFNPSSTTFVKHFISTTQLAELNENTVNVFCAGYGNTTSSIDAVKFQMSSGNIDSGKIKLYGIKDS